MEDNIFYGIGFSRLLEEFESSDGATIFTCPVSDPERYGVVEFDYNFNALSIEEKPDKLKSNYVVPDIYFYDNAILENAKNIRPSHRGEHEITVVNAY